MREISGGKLPSQQELTAAQGVGARARGAVRSAEAAVAQAQATLDVQQADLARAVIRSPIDGVVLAAAARPGQTVAASLQAPVLFTLAGDLHAARTSTSASTRPTWASVREGQAVRFSVDAWPGRSFSGRVEQVRFGAHTQAGVVSYETIVAVDNPELLLRPGMTATAEIEVQRDEQVLLAPNAALRFEPPGTRGGGAARRPGLAASRQASLRREPGRRRARHRAARLAAAAGEAAARRRRDGRLRRKLDRDPRATVSRAGAKLVVDAPSARG